MRKGFVGIAGLLISSAALLMAQQTPATQPRVMGRGRGGAPYAWNDKNKDGICDVTGKPVGQGPGAGFGRGARCGRGRGRGMGRGYRMQQQQTAPAPAPARK
jgi:hypothetical protein